MTIRAIFFDFGGVVAQYNRDGMRRVELKLGLDAGDILRAMYSRPEWKDVQVGALTEDVWRESVTRGLEELLGYHLPPNERGKLFDIIERWHDSFLSLDQRVLGLAKSLSDRYAVGLLSNATLAFEEQLLAPAGILDMWHVIVNSARVSVAKPDNGIYRIAAELVGVRPSECIHVDDMEENVEGARAAGFRAIHHTGDFVALERGLRELGVDSSLNSA